MPQGEGLALPPGIPSPLVIGGDIHYPPYEFLDKDGHPSGLNVDLSRAISQATGVPMEIRLGVWKNMRKALDDGEIHVLQGISHSPSREAVLSFSAPYTTVEYSIFARVNSPLATQLLDLEGKTVVVEEGGVMHEYLARHHPTARLLLTYNHENALRLLASGEGDFALVAATAGQYMITEQGLTGIHIVGTPVSLEKYCYAVLKKNEALLAVINQGLERIKADGTYKRISDKWLGEPGVRGISHWTVLKYGAAVFLPMLAVLLLSLTWSSMLRKRVAERTQALKEEVRQHQEARQELERKQRLIIHSDRMATLGSMATGIAHEVNNPNGLILMNLPILKDACQDALEALETRCPEHGDLTLAGLPFARMRDEIPTMFEDMSDSAERIKHIVRDLKDFARKDEQAEMEPLDLDQLLKASVRLLAGPIKKATDNFAIVDSPEALPKVFGNPRRIQQVIVNLVLNACEALPDRSKAIAVRLSHDAAAGMVILQVEDEGIGIAPEHLDHVTDPFFTTKRDIGGTGLGLAVSAGIVKAHGGGLELRSAPGRGTTARMALPAIPG